MTIDLKEIRRKIDNNEQLTPEEAAEVLRVAREMMAVLTQTFQRLAEAVKPVVVRINELTNGEAWKQMKETIDGDR